MKKILVAACLLFIILCLVGAASAQGKPGPAQADSTQSSNLASTDLELARRYAPVLYLHPDEIYQPQSVDPVLSISRLRQSRRMWFDTTLLNGLTMQELFGVSSDENSFLDQWFGDTGSSEYANFSSHKEIYESLICPDIGGSASLAYVHVVHNTSPEYTTIQYWLYYFYNDWINKHEGDWELVEVILLADEQPGWVVYSQHHGGVRRSWETTPLEEGMHPVVYVARGSHANYFATNEVFTFKQAVGNKQLVLVDRTGSGRRVLPGVILIPSRGELSANPAAWPGAGWMMFRGRWGETAVYGDFNGPYGPADKGLQWEDPYTWGIGQPLDSETWYKNRLRVQVTGSAEDQAGIWLMDTMGQKISQAENFGNVAVLHIEPAETIMAYVEGIPGATGKLTVFWPDPEHKTVSRTAYSGFEIGSNGLAQLELSSERAILISAAGRLDLSSQRVGVETVVWDAPDSVLVGNALPIHEILGGLLLSLLISLVPVLVLVAILYWVDQYHKGPAKLLAVAFAWGAVPALLVAFVVQLLFNIPPDLMGPSVLEVIRLGVFAPVVEEILKAAGVLFIFWRFRKDVNDVLDGMIYGAVVGFGFAFISNLFRYAGSFIASGFPALNLSFVVERTVHVLNHGLYTAIFGACLGFAAMAKDRRRFWAVCILGLVLAIATHALQNLLSNSLVGLNVLTVIVTSAGTLLLWVVAGWSLIQQRRLLRQELHGLVHENLYTTIQDPLARLKAQWGELRRGGLRTWLRMRRLQGLCIQLARARLQARLQPEKVEVNNKVETLQAQISQAFDQLYLARK